MREQPTPARRQRGFVPTPANPLVYHLHGHLEMPQSLVLTEDDYLEFLVRISRRHERCCRTQIRARSPARRCCSSATASPTGTSASSTAGS